MKLKIETSLLLTLAGVILLYSTALITVVAVPRHIDPQWMLPSSYYQVQMYEVADPNFFISSEATGVKQLQYVHRLQKGFTLLAFQESETTRLVAPPELEKYITPFGEKKLKLTSNLLLLRDVVSEPLKNRAKERRESLQAAAKEKKEPLIDYHILELYDPQKEEIFSITSSDGVIHDFVDKDFLLLDPPKASHHKDPGLIFVKNPEEYRISPYGIGDTKGWKYDPAGRVVTTVDELTGSELGFRSRKELIAIGEQTYAIEGCWYCHTDQTRTLVEDVVLNGSESFPAPPSSPNEYIYQKVTFPGTRRIGPDMSRVAIKRPSRDWHKAHFWAPKTASAGSIMPSFRHFFDEDPRGTAGSTIGIPNQRFEAIYQYLMTKGTRITPPTEAWWLGKDPVKTLEIIEGLRK